MNSSNHLTSEKPVNGSPPVSQWPFPGNRSTPKPLTLSFRINEPRSRMGHMYGPRDPIRNSLDLALPSDPAPPTPAPKGWPFPPEPDCSPSISTISNPSPPVEPSARCASTQGPISCYMSPPATPEVPISTPELCTSGPSVETPSARCVSTQGPISCYMSPPATPEVPISTPELRTSGASVETQATHPQEFPLVPPRTTGLDNPSHSVTESNPSTHEGERSITEVNRQVSMLPANEQDLLEAAQKVLSTPSNEVSGGTRKGKNKRKLTIVHSPDREANKRARLMEVPAQLQGMNLNDSRNHSTTAPIQGVQPTYEILSRQMSSEEMFQCLVGHGCIDLSLRMDPKQYSEGLVDGGAFGDIWKGKLDNGTEVAIKVWRFHSIQHDGPKPMKHVMREMYYWSKVKHENIQELMGVIMFQGRLGMVSLWMHHGNLRKYVSRNPDVDRYSLCVQVATGVLYLHSQNMVHGDIKAANVLVSQDGIAKLSDFDHSIMSDCSLAFSETSNMGGGTTRWMAPELITDNDSRSSTHTDIYALGMTMLEIITGGPPYYPECRRDSQVILAVTQKKIPKRDTTYFGNNSRADQMWELLLRCWSHEPATRPRADQVLKSLKALPAAYITRRTPGI